MRARGPAICVPRSRLGQVVPRMTWLVSSRAHPSHEIFHESCQKVPYLMTTALPRLGTVSRMAAPSEEYNCPPNPDGGETFSDPVSIVENVLYDQGSRPVVGSDGT